MEILIPVWWFKAVFWDIQLQKHSQVTSLKVGEVSWSLSAVNWSAAEGNDQRRSEERQCDILCNIRLKWVGFLRNPLHKYWEMPSEVSSRVVYNEMLRRDFCKSGDEVEQMLMSDFPTTSIRPLFDFRLKCNQSHSPSSWLDFIN